MTELGTRIRQARRDAGFRNAESLSVVLEVGVRTVQRWEQGKSEPSVRQLLQVAELTRKPLSFFLVEEVAA